MKPSEYWNDDHTEREFEESGLQCCTRTNDMGHRCGYVALPEGHPLFGKDWSACYDIDAPDLDVDGGVTFANGTDGMWILGWDAAHAWHRPDPSIMSPEFMASFERFGHICYQDAVMIDADMAESETRRFARQLAGMMREEESCR